MHHIGIGMADGTSCLPLSLHSKFGGVETHDEKVQSEHFFIFLPSNNLTTVSIFIQLIASIIVYPQRPPA
jgi:hypothetical protein